MVVADRERLLLLSGSGEVHRARRRRAGDRLGRAGGAGGGPGAGRAHHARRRRRSPREALRIASAIDLYTNDHISVEVVP